MQMSTRLAPWRLKQLLLHELDRQDKSVTSRTPRHRLGSEISRYLVDLETWCRGYMGRVMRG
jgi:hypothetical protein